MIKRHAEQTIRDFQKGYPAIVITGPRQSGKTTLARHIFSDRPYVSFENPDILERVLDDPRGFLATYKDGAVFDEAQRAPEMFSYLQQIIDEDPSHCRFVITGSQQFNMLSQITQSLAGRTALIHLLPFAFHELYPDRATLIKLDPAMHTGLYPPIHDRQLDPVKWYAQYVNTYIERDVRQLLKIRDLTTFQRFVRLCAARCGQLVNTSDLARDTGTSHTTIKSWLSILQASYVIFLLQPHFENYGKRLVKTPKLYFYDTGLACWLMGIRDWEQLNIHPNRGAIFESFVISELTKNRYNHGLPADCFFWRDKQGLEIDVIAEVGHRYHALEIKSGATFRTEFTKNLHKWSKLSGDKVASRSIVYGGEESFTFKENTIYSWRDTNWLKAVG